MKEQQDVIKRKLCEKGYAVLDVPLSDSNGNIASYIADGRTYSSGYHWTRKKDYYATLKYLLFISSETAGCVR